MLHKRLESGQVARNRTAESIRLATQPPPVAVRQAWRDGWTGKGTNTLVVGWFRDKHVQGYLATLSAMSRAPRANYFGMEIGSEYDGTYRGTGLRSMQNNASGYNGAKFHAINLGFWTKAVPVGQSISVAQVQGYWGDRSRLFADLSGSDFMPNTADAVIVAAAGDEKGGDAGESVSNLALTRHHSTGPRTLIVGASADYSNVAGPSLAMQKRFLVEYGGTPLRGNQIGGRWTSYSRLCDRDTTTECRNPRTFSIHSPGGTTAFAAARVTGYVSLVRQKFPNLTGAQTSNLLLDTATYDGLDSSDAEIYGQGRVDIGRALAPVGAVE